MVIENKYENWKDIPWNKIKLEIYNLQYKIYCHAKKDNIGLIRYCQRKLVKLLEAKFLVVKFITQDNRGKVTPGVDGVKSLKPVERIRLAYKLRFDGKASKIRRVFISKSNGELRPLGIPTMEDRAKQMLMKLALEPEWEARFETNSYGFRPGYSVADAKWCIARQLQGGPKYFLDADIEYLINKLNTISMFKAQIWSWLKAGIMDSTENGSSEINNMGTPQGGVLSPLLMNIALHGLETHVVTKFGRDKIKLIRYADDFVVFGKTLKDVQKAEKLVQEFLEPVGLSLSAEKTRIGHSMENMLEATGTNSLDFLSFTFQNIKCSRHRGVKNTRGVTQPFRLSTKPSRQAVVSHKKALKRILIKYKNAPLGAVMKRLGSQIKRWTWYHSITQSTRTFSKMDTWLWQKLWIWAKKRYRGANKAKAKCFSVKGWAFGYSKNGQDFILDRHDKTKVRKFVKIKPGVSIYDGNLLYFAERLSYSNPRIKSLRGLFIKQNYSCSHCGLLLLPNEIIELHHVLDSNLNRTEEICFVHGHCHDDIHSTDKSK